MSNKVSVGDSVRYLNAVGGGKVTRIDGDIAYVDEDGFDTPVPVRECVVVAHAGTPKATPKVTITGPDHHSPLPSKDVTPKKSDAPAPSRLPIIETAGGNKITITVGFEPTQIKALSQSDFDAYIVNDSNYWIYVAVSTRAADASEWTLRYDGLIEPNIQEYAFTLGQSELAHFDRLAVQYMAFKRDKSFAAKAPGSVDFKVDATKFAKLHCFRPNPYFDSPVIAFDVVDSDTIAEPQMLDAESIAHGIMQKQRDTTADRPRHVAPTPQRRPDIIEVDLHASELFESTAGLSPADILNYQIERFSQTMDAHLRHPGQKIVFIHGKGEGVLRQAIMKELTHRYKGHDVQDASFREYGFGATQVTIRQQPTQEQGARQANNKKDKKRRLR